MNRPRSPAGGGPIHPVDAVDADPAPHPDSVSVGSVDNVVHVYTRRQALADGVLVDVTRQASPAEMHGGFLVSVAVTAAVWAAIEAIPPSLHGIADPRGRLHDVLFMASLAARRSFPVSPTPLLFAVLLPVAGSRQRKRLVRVDVGPDDDGSPCVTIGFPEDF